MTPAGSQGVFASVRRLSGSMLALMRTRIALFAVELQEEKVRALSLLAWFCAALAIGLIGLLVAIGALALFLWQRAGYAGVLTLAGVLLAAGVALLWALRRRLRSGTRPFAETTAEFERDLEWLHRQD
jgi:uncharacterized membrane protein YqjE